MMDVDSNASVEDRTRRATSVLSMDDIEAAQALEGLRSGTCLVDGGGCWLLTLGNLLQKVRADICY